jgi:hypothetical protein
LKSFWFLVSGLKGSMPVAFNACGVQKFNAARLMPARSMPAAFNAARSRLSVQLDLV